MKRSIKKYLPSKKWFSSLRLERYFGNRINDPKLWIVNRESVASAVAIGIFSAYIPIPIQMVFAALLAIVFRSNLPLAVALVWISNPLTWLLFYTPPYLLGLTLLGEPLPEMESLSAVTLLQQIPALWLGCLIFGVALGAGGYVLVQVLWKLKVMNNWGKRRERRKAMGKKKPLQ